MVIALDAQLDAEGHIVSWRHDLWSNGHTHRPGRADKPVLIAAEQIGQRFERAPATDPALPAGGAHRNAIPIYDFSHVLVIHPYVRHSPVRGSAPTSLPGLRHVLALQMFSR